MSRSGRWPLLLLFCALASACGLPAVEGEVDHDAIFNKDRVANWEISVSDEDWHNLLLDKSTYVSADVEVDGVLYRDVGLRLVGNANRSKLGMRIRFDRFKTSLHFHGVKRVNLNNNAGDPSLVREALALHLMRRAGVPAPRSSFAWVSLGTGEGVYTLVEQVDRRFLQDRFGENDGQLYKVERGGNLVYRGEDFDNYDWLNTYELKGDELPADHSALIEFMRLLDQSPSEDLQERLSEALDVDGFLLMLAVNSWLSNMDSYPGSGGNIYLYRDSDGRFRVIPWDLNRAFGNFHGRHCKHAVDEEACTEYGAETCRGRDAEGTESEGEGTESEGREYCVEYYAELCAEDSCEYCEYTTDEMLTLDPDTPTCSADRPLVDTVLGVPAFKERYHEHLRVLIDGVLKPQAVEKDMETMRALISDTAAQDVWRDRAAQDASKDVVIHDDFDASFTTDLVLDIEDRWEDRVPGLMPFVEARDELIRNNL